MPQTARTFRIFVSSTFSDLVAERNALQEHVFPRLRELCEQHGCRFQAIDLRWGVSEEAGLDQQTMKICLTEIARCQRVTPRPNFIILLGDRYGWRPLPYAIPADEMERLLPRLTPEERRLALWDEDGSCDSAQDAVSRGMVAWQNGNPTGEHGWYRLDTNSVPAAYLLQPRPHDSPFADYGYWAEQVERPLHAILERAARETFGVSEYPGGSLKYTASATHQEIVHGALRVEDAAEHVFGFFRAIANLPELAAELPSSPAFDFVDTMADGTFDAMAHGELHNLKDGLKAQLGSNVVEYQTRWTGTGLTGDHIGALPASLDQCVTLNKSQREPGTLCEAVWQQLSRVILDQVNELEAANPLIAEQQAHDAFGQERARLFVGRGDLLGQVASYLAGNDRHPLVIMGPSGSGKSALIAKIAAEARERYPKAHVVTRFIGATPGSTNGRTLLEDLTRQIVRAYGGHEANIPAEYSALAFTFRDRLALATAKRPLVLLVDALDQLTGADEASNLTWLPAELPKHVHLVVSASQDGIPEPIRYHLTRFADKRPFEVVQSLRADDGEAILDGWLAEPLYDPLIGLGRRTLTADQRNDVLAKFASAGGLPLYLKVACDEARRWPSFHGLPALSDAQPGLAANVPGVIRDLLWRLEQPGNHGATLVSHALGYLAAARHGLSEDELLDVLSADVEVLVDFHRRSPNSPTSDRLPAVVWSRLYFDLEPYLAERNAPGGGALLGFYHRQMAEVAAAYALIDEKGTARHRSLAAYFAHQPTWLAADNTRPTLRKAAELAYQQTRAGLWPELTATLTDFDFLEAVVRALSVYDLEADYRRALAAWGGAQTDHGLVAAFEERLRLESHHIYRAPELLFPQLYNYLTGQDGPDGPLHILCEQAARKRNGWLRNLRSLSNPQAVPPIGEASPPEQKMPPRGEASSPEQKMAGFNEEILEAVPALREFAYPMKQEYGLNAIAVKEGQVIVGSQDRTIKVWDLESNHLIRVLEGHTESVRCVTLTSHSSCVSGSSDCTIKVWDQDNGRLLRTLAGHTKEVRAVAIENDTIVSGSLDTTVKIWDLDSGRLLRTLFQHASGITAVALTGDGRVVCGSQDGMILICDMESGRLLYSRESPKEVAKGYPNEVVGVLVTKNKYIVSGSLDWKVRIWNLDDGQLVHTLHVPSGPPLSISVILDGEKGAVVSGSENGLIHVWDLESGQWSGSLQKHSLAVTGIALTPEKRMFSCSLDGTIAAWDIETGGLVMTLDGTKGDHQRSSPSIGASDSTLSPCMEENLIPVNAVLLSKDDYVISTSPDGKVKLWDLHTGGLLRSIAVHTKEVTSLALTQDGLLVTGSADKTIGIVDLASGHVLRVLEGHADRVNSVAITGDGRVVSGSADKSIKIWDLETGRILRTIESALQLKNLLTGHTRSVNCIVVTEDGWIVSGSDDPKYNMIKIWDLESGWLLADLNGHTDGVVTLAITNDRRILSCSKDSTIGVWDLSNASKPSIDERASLAQGLPTSILRGHTQSVNAVMLVAENRLISASEDKTIKLWDLETGKFQDLFGADASIRTLSLSWDNRWLVCGDAQGRMRRFEFVYSEDNRSLERGWREPDVSVAASPKPISKDFCAMAVVILAVRIVDVMGLPILIGWQQRSWTAFAAGLMITFLGVGLSLFGLSNIDHPAGRLVARGTTTLIVLLWGWLGWQLGSATPIRCLAPALCGIAVLLSFAIHVLWYTQAVAASKLSRETGSAK